MRKLENQGLTLLFAHLLLPILIGLLVGFFAATNEILIRILPGPIQKGPTYALLFFDALILYGAMGGIFGLIAGLVGIGVSALRKRTAKVSTAIKFYLAFQITLFLYLTLGTHINYLYLRGFYELESIISNIIFTILALGLFYLLYKIILEAVLRFIRTSIFLKAAFVSVILVSFALPVIYIRPLPNLTLKRPSYIKETGSRRGINALIICLDSLRPDHLSCYGYEKKTSPTIDSLADEGVRVLNAYAHGSWTLPSVTSLLTSLYPPTHQMEKSSDGLSPEVITLFDIMEKNGFAVGLFSGSDFISPTYGFYRGIDYLHARRVFLGSRLTLSRLLIKLKKFRMLPGFVLEWDQMIRDFLLGREPPEEIGHIDIDLVDGLTSWIGKNRNVDWFAYLHLMTPHGLFKPSPEFSSNIFGSDDEERPVSVPPGLDAQRPFEKSVPLPGPDLKILVKNYDRCISFADDNVRKVIEKLKELGIYKDTLIILTADHGEEFYEHGGWGHGHSLYEEIIHAPLIFVYPNSFPKGRVVAELVRHIDIMPTILDLCGINYDGPMEGMSLRPMIMEEKGYKSPDFVFSETFFAPVKTRSLRNDRYKLIYAKKYKLIYVKKEEKLLLFDVENDPKELVDIKDKEPSLANELYQKMDQIYKDALKKAKGPVEVILDEETKERLRSLGYLQ